MCAVNTGSKRLSISDQMQGVRLQSSTVQHVSVRSSHRPPGQNHSSRSDDVAYSICAVVELFSSIHEKTNYYRSFCAFTCVGWQVTLCYPIWQVSDISMFFAHCTCVLQLVLINIIYHRYSQHWLAFAFSGSLLCLVVFSYWYIQFID